MVLFKRIESPGLAHYSYIIGDGGKAVVIDPRLDYQIYLEEAAAAAMRITDILETHRNEDYCVGSVALADATGAQIWHADATLPYLYGKPAADGQVWKMGSYSLRALLTPGHTPGSVSYLLCDSAGIKLMAFTGDTLFAGDVGRTDFLGAEKLQQLTGMLYDSIYDRLLPLGDEVIVCPAHGAGSACGSAIADRPLTTIGMERRYNPRLQAANKEEFIQRAAVLERPPYFLHIEELNIRGAKLPVHFPYLAPLTIEHFREAAKTAHVLDTRSHLSFAAAHIPKSFHIYPSGLSAYAGWFLPPDEPCLLVVEPHALFDVVGMLTRMGFSRLQGYLASGIHGWYSAGNEVSSVRTISVEQLCQDIDAGQQHWILDVRKHDELEKNGRIPHAFHVPLTMLTQQLDSLPHDREIFVFCASGMRSMIAAGILLRHGYRPVVILGGFLAWNSVQCPVEK